MSEGKMTFTDKFLDELEIIQKYAYNSQINQVFCVQFSMTNYGVFRSYC